MQEDVSRRQFVTATAAAAAIAACTCMFDGAGQCAFAADDATKTIDAGALADFKDDKVYDTLTASSAIFIVRNAGKLYAMTSICTHRNKNLKLRAGVITCPAHNSKFSTAGTVDKGPAKKSLARYAISKDAKGHVIVDKSKSFSENQWDDPASFIDVKA